MLAVNELGPFAEPVQIGPGEIAQVLRAAAIVFQDRPRSPRVALGHRGHLGELQSVGGAPAFLDLPLQFVVVLVGLDAPFFVLAGKIGSLPALVLVVRGE